MPIITDILTVTRAMSVGTITTTVKNVIMVISTCAIIATIMTMMEMTIPMTIPMKIVEKMRKNGKILSKNVAQIAKLTTNATRNAKKSK